MNKKQNHITPPRLAQKLLLLFLKEELAEEVQGDLEEKFYQTVNHHSLFRAKRNYWFQVINYIRPFALKRNRSYQSKPITMFRHNFKVSTRQMLNNKGYSAINVFGLALGMTVAMLIGLWVHDELTFNQYHEEYDTTYQLLRQENGSKGRYTSEWFYTGMGALLKETLPHKLENLLMSKGTPFSRVLAHGDKKLSFSGLYAESHFPSFFGLDMKYGNEDGLNDLYSIMLSESTAKKLFGDQNPVGELISMDITDQYMVSGVYFDLPKNSEFSGTDYLSSYKTFFAKWPERLNIWDNMNTKVYAKIQPGNDLEELNEQINGLFIPRLAETSKERDPNYLLHPMSQWHTTTFVEGVLGKNQTYRYIWMYGFLGVFVLTLACINFMNLSTARSEKRAKEVGVRKTLGSLRQQLISQFYLESFLYSFLAFVLSLLLLKALLPWFNHTSAKDIVPPWQVSTFWLACISFIIFTTLIAGSYPAAYLSSFKPINALRGGLKFGKRATTPRKVLVVFQFLISVMLIIGSITINNQIQEAKNRPIGYSPNGMISISPTSPNYHKNRAVLRQEILNTGMVTEVGFSNYSITNDRGWNNGFRWDGMDPAFDESFNTVHITEGFAEAMGMEFIAGRNFDPTRIADKNGIILNESALQAMQLEDPIGMVITYDPSWAEAANFTIVGVVKDMIKASPFEQTRQSVMFNSEDKRYTAYMYMRLNPDVSASESLSAIEQVFNEILPEAPFDYRFADDDYNKKFEAEIRISDLAIFFTILAILISCLGLFGLSAFVAEQKTKEIGIRKVLGASILHLWQLLSKEFAVLVLTASIIAIPIAHYFLEDWLSTYELRTKLSWDIFAFAGLGGLAITLITVSYQSLKAALANPVDSLRTE